MIRLLPFVFLLTVAGVQAQVQIGIEAGVPLTDTFSTTEIGPYAGNGSFLEDAYSSRTKRLLIGPAVRLVLPFRLGLEVDALYQRVNYEETYLSGGGQAESKYFSHNTADRWQFPLLVQYTVKVPLLKPFVEIGPSLSHIFNGHNTLVLLNTNPGSQQFLGNTIQANRLSELLHNTVLGATAGLGVDFHILFLHIRPEFRYTRWVSAQFSGASPYNDLVTARSIPTNLPLPGVGQPSISSRLNEVSFLLGVTF